MPLRARLGAARLQGDGAAPRVPLVQVGQLGRAVPAASQGQGVAAGSSAPPGRPPRRCRSTCRSRGRAAPTNYRDAPEPPRTPAHPCPAPRTRHLGAVLYAPARALSHRARAFASKPAPTRLRTEGAILRSLVSLTCGRGRSYTRGARPGGGAERTTHHGSRHLAGGDQLRHGRHPHEALHRD